MTSKKISVLVGSAYQAYTSLGQDSNNLTLLRQEIDKFRTQIEKEQAKAKNVEEEIKSLKVKQKELETMLKNIENKPISVSQNEHYK
jgi:uncharacterized coiled-coil DUF342 family protein